MLDRVPALVLLDNFEDNLRPAGLATGWGMRRSAGCWPPGPRSGAIAAPGDLPVPVYPADGAERFLAFRQLGALSRAETTKLAWSLAALDKLSRAQLERVWRLVGGHPRSLEYLDALLAGGRARYPDVTARLHTAITRQLGGAQYGAVACRPYQPERRPGRDRGPGRRRRFARRPAHPSRPRSPAQWIC